MKNDLAFIITELNNSVTHHNILTEINKIAKSNPYNQVCVFNTYSEKIDSCNVPMLPINHAKFFKGNIFVFDTLSLMLIKDFPNIINKYFYAQNSEWIDNYSDYYIWKSLFLQDNLNIITSSDILYDIYELCWQKPIMTMENFSSQELMNVIR